MDSGIKQRLLGAAVLVALIVVILPMAFNEPAPDSGGGGLSFWMPAAPEAETAASTILSLGEQDAPLLDEAAGGAETVAGDVGAAAAPLPADTGLPPVAAGGAYVVHYAAFATQADADLTVSQLHAHALPAYSESIMLHGRPAVRVRVGPYQSQAEAEIVRVQAAQVRNDVQPRVFMLIDQAAAERTAAALARTGNAAPARAAVNVGFVVQLGAFSRAEGADSLQKRLQQAGIVAFTDTVETVRGTLTRVNAGPVSSHAEAERLKARIKSAMAVEGVVRAHP